MSETREPEESIIFLGTGGARFVVSTQVLATGGIWLKLNGTEILLDPGPGCIVQSTKRKLRAEKLAAIVLSHRHLDHSGDVNVMVEAMTQGGFKPHGYFFAPADALDSEPVLYSYLRKSLAGIELLKEGGSYTVDSVSFTTPVRHIHTVETYGIIFKTPRHSFAYIADTHYFDKLSQYYPVEMIILNTVFLEPIPHLDHLSIPEAQEIIGQIKPKVAILTHFGMNVWRAKPWELAEKMSQKTGVRVIAARDGMTFDLAEVDKG
ncbi:MAG: MBL fold metallo-hydrolase [Chloroflexota bacterium]